MRINLDETRRKPKCVRVELIGKRDVMFDRYAGDNSTKLEWHQKLYLSRKDGATIVLPSLNIISLLSAHNTNSAPKRLRDKRKYKDICNAHLSFVSVQELEIPFLRDGKPILFGRYDPTTMVDPLSGVYMHSSVARLDKGIPNPKERPVLPLPWSLVFHLDIEPNNEIKEQETANLFNEAGSAIGIGTFRGVFGKYILAGWDEV